MASRTRGFIDVQIIGDQRGVDHMLNRLEIVLSPVGLEAFLLSTVEPWLQERAQNRFDSEGDDVVGTWAPLKPATVNMRQERGYGGAHPINRRTGDLEEYIVDSPARITELPSGAVLTTPGNKATGELADKVETAQIGRDYPNTVPRPVLGMNETDLAFVLGSLAKFVQESV